LAAAQTSGALCSPPTPNCAPHASGNHRRDDRRLDAVRHWHGRVERQSVRPHIGPDDETIVVDRKDLSARQRKVLTATDAARVRVKSGESTVPFLGRPRSDDVISATMSGRLSLPGHLTITLTYLPWS
jgi:hypothetical protein